MGRILIFTGKGGVGKTSTAAAHALHSAKEGKKTLLVSTDMAHNLSDLFECRLGKDATEVYPSLFALELDPHHILEEDFQEIKQAFLNFLSSPQFSKVSMEQFTAFPGMDELISLLKIMEIYCSDAYDRIIVDCAPTGETLALLKFPELFSWYMEKFFPVGKVAVRVLSPITKAAMKVELPNKKAMNDIERIYLKLMKLQELLKNKEVTSIRLVCLPEKMVVEETKRNYMYMNLYNFQVDGLYINRILPADMENPFFQDWIGIQNDYLEELEAVFAGLPVYRIPWFGSDLNGLSGVEYLEEAALNVPDLFAVRSSSTGECYAKTDGGYQLSLSIPCASKQDLDLKESGTDIILKAGTFKRNIPKPNVLRSYRIASAKLADHTLIIRFEKSEQENAYANHL